MVIEQLFIQNISTQILFFLDFYTNVDKKAQLQQETVIEEIKTKRLNNGFSI